MTAWKKTGTRLAATLLATAGIAAGSVAATAPAQAAAPNLAVTGGVYCQFAQPGTTYDKVWSMTRYLKVTAYDFTFHNVNLQEINGGRKFAAELKPGQSLEIKTTWFGCFPSSISGYASAAEYEPLGDNFGFWFNVTRIDNPFVR
ncbi:hypothetical protein [Williamsia sterculiae]|uniref:Uncharacterized protein n=1 Tax=Williamsia sterculiae TaxID=1344003 RepID=A0A1N7CQ62_9NOCA|nr:hypothetical protein [Williamsia sterculiae]SIR65771.1 hypothetical protein SAMN05445060_0290 [Williamsia sterculiae]